MWALHDWYGGITGERREQQLDLSHSNHRITQFVFGEERGIRAALMSALHDNASSCIVYIRFTYPILERSRICISHTSFSPLSCRLRSGDARISDKQSFY